MQEFSTRGPRQFAHREAHRFILHAIESAEVVFVPQQEVHVRAVHAVVDGSFDVKDVQCLIDDFAKRDDFVIQLRARRVHVTVGIANRLGFVVHTQRLVIAEPDSH